MGSVLYMAFLFFAKMLDNALSTAKTILIQRNRCLLAGVCLAVSNYIYLLITKDVVSSDMMAPSTTHSWQQLRTTLPAQ